MIKKISRREAISKIGTVLLGSTALGACAHLSRRAARAADVAQRKPNVLYFMVDDLSRSALGLYGNPYVKTPNIDRVFASGIRFDEAFVTNSLCSPSRASYLTGAYSHRHGILGHARIPKIYNLAGLAANQSTFPRTLNENGYYTGVFGKWHIPSRPVGFNEWKILEGQGTYFNSTFRSARGVTRATQNMHVDDQITEFSSDFLKRRPKSLPFCLLVNFKAAHSNWIPAARHEREFENVDFPFPKGFNKLDRSKPSSIVKTDLKLEDLAHFYNRGVNERALPLVRKRQNFQTLLKYYYRTLLSVDDNIGRLLDQIAAEGIAENTIVFFGSDNGFFLGEHGFYDKRLMYEPSIRVPMAMSYPGLIKSGQIDSENMVLNIDVAPTILDLCGVKIPPQMQGQSWRPLLNSNEAQPAKWREDFMYEFFEYPSVHCVRKHRGIRTKRWKLIQYWETPEEWELIDLLDDPYELKNVYEQYKDSVLVRDLKKRLRELRRETDEPQYPVIARAMCAGR